MTGPAAQPMSDVAGKVAFITGGSSGIGLGIAEALAEAGMKVVIGYRTERHREAALAALAPFGAEVHAVEVDVTDPVSVEAAAAETVRRFGKVHVLVANAGVAVLKTVADTSRDDWDWIVGTNLTGVFTSIRVFLPLIREHGEGGQIVATSSVMGLFTAPHHAVYSATKYGVVGLMEGLRLDLQGGDVGVSVFCPGNVWAKLEARTAAQSASTPRGAHDDAATIESLRLEYGDVAMEGIEAGRLVLQGIRNNDLYILTHPEFDRMIGERHEAIDASAPRGVRVPEARIASTTTSYRTRLYTDERDRRIGSSSTTGSGTP